MDWTALSQPAAWPRISACIVMVGLALWLVWLDVRSQARRGFAVFLLAFAGAVFCNTMAAFAADAAKQSWFLLTRHFEVVEIPAVVYFMSFYPRRRGWFARQRALRLVLLVAVAGMELLILVQPALWFTSPDGRTGLSVGTWGPLGALASKDNLAMAVVAILLARDYARSEPGPRRQGVLLVWLGFALNVLYDSATSTAWITRGLLHSVPISEAPWNRVVYGLDIVALTCGFVAFGMMLAALSRAGAARSDRLLVALTLPLPIIAALVETLVVPNVELFDSPFKLAVNGALRLALVLLPTYALVRYQLFDIDLKLKFTLRHGTAATMLAALFFIVSNTLQTLIPAQSLAVNLAAAAIALKPAETLAKRFVNRIMPEVRPEDAYIHRRKCQVYRVALDAAMEDGSITTRERRVLSNLARELGLRPSDMQAIEREVGEAAARRLQQTAAATG